MSFVVWNCILGKKAVACSSTALFSALFILIMGNQDYKNVCNTRLMIVLEEVRKDFLF